MSKVISTTVVNPNGKEDTCAYAVVDSKELYYLLSLVTAPDKYTISFFIKSLANETLTLWYGEESKEFEVTTSWQKITWNFSAEWVDNVMLQFTEGEYYIYNTMLERGNVATDYSMSQYDQKKVLKDMENTLNTKYAQLSIALDDITLEVSETSSKLGNVESSVKLMSDEIGLKVNKNGIIGAINLSSEQAQIMASKIDLVGAVTLSSLSSDVASKFDTLDDITVTDNNITYIDGGKIYTGSITADKIDVDDLFADTGFINALSTNSIIVGATNKAEQALNSVNKTVKGITMHYLATTLASGVTTSTSGWTTTVQQIDATKKYLWTYQTITYVDNTTTNTSPVISGVYGNEGVDGKGITSVTPLYYLKSNNTAPSAPTSAVTSTSTSSGVWTKSVPTYVANYTYFACTQTQYTNGTYGWSTVVADNALTNANKTANTANSTATTANNTANAIKNNIYKSGTTLIDGAKIYTGSITADKIDVDDLSALEATIGGWDIESGEINKSFPQQVTSAYGKNIKGSYSGNYLIFSTSNSQMTGLIDTHFNYWGTRFENSGGMGVEYGATGIRVAPSATALTNKEYKEVLAFSDDNVWAKKLSTEAIGCNGDAFIKNVNGETVKGGTVVTTSGADLDTVASQIPKLLTVRYSLPDITWTKSYGGLYYAYSELGSRGVNTVLAITAGNLGNIRTIDNIFFGIISGARIQICANTNSFMSGAYYEAQILYI